MKQLKLLWLVLPLLVAVMSCQIENGQEKSAFENEKMSAVEPAMLLQESLAKYDCYATEKTIPMFGILAKDATLSVIGNPADIPLAGTYQGNHAINKYFADYLRKIRLARVDIQDILREGDFINVHLRLQGLVRATKNTFDLEYVYAMVLTNRRIQSMTVYYDTSGFRKAMLAAGPLAVADVQNPVYPRSNPADTNNYKPLIEAGIKAFYIDGDIPAFLSLVHPDIYWAFKGDSEHVPFAGLYHGFPGMMQFLTNIAPNLYPLEITVTGSLQQGNRIDYQIIERGYAIPTGKEYKAYVLQTFLIQDNKAIEFKTYNDSYAVAQAYLTN